MTPQSNKGRRGRGLMIATVVAIVAAVVGWTLWHQDDPRELPHPIVIEPPTAEAPAALPRLCGPTDASKSEVSALSSLTGPNTGLIEVDRKSLLRLASGLPPELLAALKKHHVELRFVEQKQAPEACLQQPANARRQADRPALCYQDDGTQSVLYMVLGNEPPTYRIARAIHHATPVALFWLATEVLWASGQASPILSPDASDPVAAMWLLKRQLSMDLDVGKEDARAFGDEFGPAWRQAPAFWTRNLAVTAYHYYCSGETAAHLRVTQPKVFKTFQTTWACVFGKPWYASKIEFAERCKAS